MTRKKKWEKPKLIILLREANQEGILQTCKEGMKFTGPSEHFSACHFNWYRDSQDLQSLILIQECLDCQHLDVS